MMRLCPHFASRTSAEMGNSSFQNIESIILTFSSSSTACEQWSNFSVGTQPNNDDASLYIRLFFTSRRTAHQSRHIASDRGERIICFPLWTLDVTDPSPKTEEGDVLCQVVKMFDYYYDILNWIFCHCYRVSRSFFIFSTLKTTTPLLATWSAAVGRPGGAKHMTARVL